MVSLQVGMQRKGCLWEEVRGWASCSDCLVGLLLLHDYDERFNFFHVTVLGMDSRVLRQYFPRTQELLCA